MDWMVGISSVLQQMKVFFTYFFGNNWTFGLRELYSTDWCSTPIVIPSLTDERFRFTSNCEVRLYTLSCFYFDEKSEEWKSDGLTVGPLSSHFQTQCFSTHCLSSSLCFLSFAASRDVRFGDYYRFFLLIKKAKENFGLGSLIFEIE